MNATRKTIPSAEGQRQLDALRQAVGNTLEQKRRLGQYAVTWHGGEPVVTGDDAPDS
jgi:sulfatase maturation enzyme AslB (radical SAM superfamily)